MGSNSPYRGPSRANQIVSVNSKHLHKIIVGVDFGTTFTGVSYVDSTKKAIEDINVIRTWPGPSREQDETWKTPSRIAYGQENQNSIEGNNIKWGYQVKPGMKSYSWTKLLLDPERPLLRPFATKTDVLEGDGLMKIPEFKTSARDVCSDYLREIYNYTYAHLEKHNTSAIMNVTALEFWFTVPAIWSDKAKNETYQAAYTAGFGTRIGDSISMIPEPEAAAVATLSAMAKDERHIGISVGDGILICDCGGGTVDIVTYLIKQVRPDLRFEELLVGTGDKCGSTYIDREFHKWMLKMFGEGFEKIKFEKKGPGSRFMKDFEGHKRDFGAMNHSDQTFEVELVIPGAWDSAHYDSENSMVLFGRSEMESFFKPVTDQIEALLTKQVRQLREKSRASIKKVVLVGGFGDSRHLESILRNWCGRQGIDLLCPENPQASIVKGAALRGLNGIRPEKRLCRLHYGFKIDTPFRENFDPESRAYIWPWDGRSKYCHDRMRWLIEKVFQVPSSSPDFLLYSRTKSDHQGKPISEETRNPLPLRQIHHYGDSLSFSFDVYTCDETTAPEWYEAGVCRSVGTIRYSFSLSDLSRFQSKIDSSGRTMYHLEYSIQADMFADKGLLEFKLTGSDGKEIGKTEIEYD
ncbi:uncharacterized protein N7482_002188 [Penicillium canariense]|uniref:Actin-like ATPase domain-containing protein n=1 Tax=Penicillium canariense TaxID=189055 RepID=A0A9W9IIJ4_9EURO|nr:uncharacterized protein N7482_002188 [Penicillium canariense]KAJ5176311.1 hypothetical protein N7482_002188 [Penicillium canariense]